MKPSEAGKWVYAKLDVQAVNALVHGRIYAFTTMEPQPMPWIVYDNIVMDYDTTKDGNTPSTLTCTVTCSGETHDEAMEVADAVYEALNDVDDCLVTTVRAIYDDNVGHIVELDIKKYIYE